MTSATDSISCEEYRFYREFESVKWVRYLRSTSVDAFPGDEEEKMKELCRAHYSSCDSCLIWQYEQDRFTSPGIK